MPALPEFPINAFRTGEISLVSVMRHQSPRLFPPTILNVLKRLNGLLRESAGSESDLPGIDTRTRSIQSGIRRFRTGFSGRLTLQASSFLRSARARALPSGFSGEPTRTEAIWFRVTKLLVGLHPQPRIRSQTKLFLLRQMRLTSLRYPVQLGSARQPPKAWVTEIRRA